MVVAITAGLQGYPPSLNNTVKVAASFTHFIGSGQAMNGRDGGPASVPLTTLMNVHLV
jgi:beta-glucosidase-like glycosyl hydrolase